MFFVVCSFASTARFATRYLFNQAGANFSSIVFPKGTSGHPASAAETKQNAYFPPLLAVKGLDCFFSIESITLNAVERVIASYVDDSPGIDPDPLTILLKFAKPESTSNRSPVIYIVKVMYLILS